MTERRGAGARSIRQNRLDQCREKDRCGTGTFTLHFRSPLTPRTRWDSVVID